MQMDKRVVVVLGSTGTGKSKLAIDLAKELDGEVINADSLQVYRGLDIITNKVTLAEQDGVSHHLLSFKEPCDEYSVLEFVQDCGAAIDDITSRGKVPIVVGGTHYYVQSLLFEASLVELDILSSKVNASEDVPKSVRDELESLFTASEGFDTLLATDKQLLCDKAWDLLDRIDPPMAQRWPRQDFRKLRRALFIYYSSGITQTEWVRRQRSVQMAPKTVYPCCIFWLFSEDKVLCERLNRRVDDMLQAGLVAEVEMLKESKDYTRGVHQAIGYKEFLPYLCENSEEVFSRCVEEVKLRTRRYARSQLKWIKGKLIPQILAQPKGRCLTLVLDSSDSDFWAERVRLPAVRAAKTFMSNDPCCAEMQPTEYLSKPLRARFDVFFKPQQTTKTWKKYTCADCLHRDTMRPREFTGLHEWQQHLQSRGHRKRLACIRKNSHEISDLQD